MKDKVLGLSPLQLGIWSRIQLYKENSEYEIPLLIEIDSKISANKIEQALNNVIEYNAALRTEIIGEIHPIQKVHEFDSLILVKKAVLDADLRKEIETFFKEPVALNGILTNYRLFIGETCQVLACKFHHIIADGHSVALFEKEFNSLLAGESLTKDKELYQNYLESDFNISLPDSTYWDTYLEQIMSPLEKHKKASSKVARSILRTDLEISVEQLEEYAVRVGGSLFTSSLGIYRMFLSRFFNQENLAVGLPITTRRSEEEENTFAFMANVLPLLLSCRLDQTGETIQQEVQTTVLDLIVNSGISATDIQKKLDGKYQAGKESLFKTIFDLQEEPNNPWISLVRESSTESEYPWLTTFILKQGKVYFETNHDCSFYPIWFMEEIHRSFQYFISTVLANPNAKISEYAVMSPFQNTEILDFGNIVGSQEYQSELNDLFLQRHEQTISYNNKVVRFEKLESYLNQFEQFIKNHGITRGAKIVVCTKNKLLGSILFYCIQKCQCCYIPISSEMPLKRVEQIIDEADPLIIMSDWLDLDQNNYVKLVDDGELNSFSTKKVSLESTNTTKYLVDISYIIFTSGSTGKPKGVPISYQNLKSLLMQYKKSFDITNTDVVAQIASFSFDASLFEMTLAFNSGAKLAIFDSSNGYEYFPKFIQEQGVTHFLLTPDYYAVLDFSSCVSLKCVLVGGSAYRSNHTMPKHVLIYNAYGPSEGTIITSIKKMNDVADLSNIGHPLGNSGVTLLNSRGELVPHGRNGEICITGQSVFSGYLDASLPAPFQQIAIEGINYLTYRTGDIGYFDEKWEIHFVSRKKKLVKIRGNRIDPEEISQLAMTLNTVSNAITVFKDNQLNVFYIGEASNLELESLFQEYLPSYMIPSHIQKLQTMPVTINGKTDFEQLNKMTLNDKSEGQIKKQGQGNKGLDSLDKKIVTVFQEVLQNSELSLQSNFFAEGGDSIQSIQIANELQKENINISSLDIIKSQTIQELCENVRMKQRDFDQRSVEGEVNLLPIQRWFFQHSFANIHHWNQSERFTVSGNYTEEQLLSTYEKIRKKHDGLRSQFIRRDNQYINIIRKNQKEELEKEVSFHLISNDVSEIEFEQTMDSILEDLHNQINISDGVLSKLAFVQTSEANFEVVWVLHHLICDNVSWLILKNDLLYGLTLLQEEKPLLLTEKTTNIKEWANYLNNYQLSEDITERWETYLPKDEDLTNGFVPEKSDEYFETFVSEIDEGLTDILLSYAKENKIEMDLLFFLLFGRSLCQLLKLPSVWIGRELNGRTEHPDEIQLNQTVGWLTSIHPVKIVDFSELQEFVSMNQFEVEKISSIGFSYQLLNKGYKTPTISYNYLGDLPDEFDLASLSKVSDINQLDFFDEIALNVGKRGETLTCIFLVKEKNYNLASQLVNAIKESIQLLTESSTTNIFGISTNTLVELNDLFL